MLINVGGNILKLRKVNFTLGRDILKNRLEELRKQRGIKQEDLALLYSNLWNNTR